MKHLLICAVAMSLSLSAMTLTPVQAEACGNAVRFKTHSKSQKARLIAWNLESGAFQEVFESTQSAFSRVYQLTKIENTTKLNAKVTRTSGVDQSVLRYVALAIVRGSGATPVFEGDKRAAKDRIKWATKVLEVQSLKSKRNRIYLAEALARGDEDNQTKALSWFKNADEKGYLTSAYGYDAYAMVLTAKQDTEGAEQARTKAKARRQAHAKKMPPKVYIPKSPAKSKRKRSRGLKTLGAL